jgi:hypothetical protein
MIKQGKSYAESFIIWDKKIAPEGAIFLIHHSELEVNTTLEQLVAADEQREEPTRSVYSDHVPKIHEAGLLYGLDRVRDRGVGVRHLNCEVASHRAFPLSSVSCVAESFVQLR